MSLFSDASAWLESQRQAVADTGIYTRDGIDCSVPVTAGKKLYRTEDSFRVAAYIVSVDFIIAFSALGFEPRRGDFITFNGVKHEVLELNGEPCWQWSDHYSKMMRVHTKQV